ncbi:MAG: c-type cytochrome [Gammaproteobacteria bacterium]|nr:c-type cytochrome [Gammaproteobacteria bacterium]
MYHRVALFLFVFCSVNCISPNTLADEKPSTETSASLEDINKGKEIYKKSNCAFCHGWSGNGRGHPRSPGVASNLRLSQLDREAMKHIIRCGVPGGAMPYHDRMAYRDKRCGIEPGSIKKTDLPTKGKSIQAREWDALLDYIIALRADGTPDLEQCEAFFKPGSLNCQYLKK